MVLRKRKGIHAVIIQGELTAEQRRCAQLNYNRFSFVNGFSYMCLGETVIILYAIRLGAPEYFISLLGGMIYFGFLLLPLGKRVTGQVGAARTQSVFWYLRNGAALLIASCSLWAWLGAERLALGLLLGGSFLFYGFRAAGVVMSQPLVGDITTNESRSRFLAINNGLFYLAGVLALLAIGGIQTRTRSPAMLSAIIAAGALLGVAATRFMDRIDETNRIRSAARRPLGLHLHRALRDREFHRLLLIGTVINILIILLVPITTLALKKGYGVSDTTALFYALAQFGAAALGSRLTGPLLTRFGSRRTLCGTYLGALTIPLLWLIAPRSFHPLYPLLLFVLAGGLSVMLGTAMTNYFLELTTADNRVAYSIFNSIITGAGAGAIGMLLGAGLLRLLQFQTGAELTLDGYRRYFLLAGVLLLPGLLLLRARRR